MIIKRLKTGVPFFIIFLFLFLFIFPSPSVLAQTTTSKEIVPAEFDMTDFPQWGKDLRRGEIVAFGSLPIMYFWVNLLYTNVPMSFATSGSSQDRRFRTIGTAAVAAVAIALVDHGIVRYKRNRLQRELRELPEGTPIIIRTPLYEEEADTLIPEQDADP